MNVSGARQETGAVYGVGGGDSTDSTTNTPGTIGAKNSASAFPVGANPLEGLSPPGGFDPFQMIGSLFGSLFQNKGNDSGNMFDLGSILSGILQFAGSLLGQATGAAGPEAPATPVPAPPPAPINDTKKPDDPSCEEPEPDAEIEEPTDPQCEPEEPPDQRCERAIWLAPHQNIDVITADNESFSAARADASATGGLTGPGYGLQAETWRTQEKEIENKGGLDKDSKFELDFSLGSAAGVGNVVKPDFALDLKAIAEAATELIESNTTILNVAQMFGGQHNVGSHAENAILSARKEGEAL